MATPNAGSTQTPKEPQTGGKKRDPEVEKLRNDLGALRSDLSALTESLRQRGYDQARSSYNRARSQAFETRDQAFEVAESLTHRIEERPIASLLTAFGVGLLLGKILGR